jgi:hypothetical protein
MLRLRNLIIVSRPGALRFIVSDLSIGTGVLRDTSNFNISNLPEMRGKHNASDFALHFAFKARRSEGHLKRCLDMLALCPSTSEEMKWWKEDGDLVH